MFSYRGEDEVISTFAPDTFDKTKYQILLSNEVGGGPVLYATS